METEKSIADRLKEYMDSLGMTNSQFADAAGIPRPTLSQLLHGRNKSINDQFLRRINESFPNLDIRWLLFGQGDMLVDPNFKTSEPKNASEVNSNNVQQPDIKVTTLQPDLFSSASSDVGKEISRIINAEKSNLGDRESKTVPVDDADSKSTAKKPLKTIESIIVLYSDKSFETFRPECV